MKKKEKLNDTVMGYCECPHIHLVGSSQCVVDGLKGIVEYSRDRIKINLGKYCLVVVRSEERRGVKECRSRWSPDH